MAENRAYARGNRAKRTRERVPARAFGLLWRVVRLTAMLPETAVGTPRPRPRQRGLSASGDVRESGGCGNLGMEMSS